jgi:hypothetical protein
MPSRCHPKTRTPARRRGGFLGVAVSIATIGVVALGGTLAGTANAVTAVSAPSASAPSVFEPGAYGALSPRLAVLSTGQVAGLTAGSQNTALGLPRTGAGSLLRDSTGATLVYVRVRDTSDATVRRLTERGRVVDVSAPYGVVTLAVGAGALTALGHTSGVENVVEALTPLIGSVPTTSQLPKASATPSKVPVTSARSTPGAGASPSPVKPSTSNSASPSVQPSNSVSPSVAPTGSRTATPTTAHSDPPRTGRISPAASQPPGKCHPVVAESNSLLSAQQVRSKLHANGAGVTVGILSDSFAEDVQSVTTAQQDVKAGNLPGKANPCGFHTPVKVLEDGLGFGLADEGRAMAQIVYDVAPAAQLMFASAVNGEYAMAKSIRDLYAAGARVIVDDITYYEEPFWQRGPIGDAVAWVNAHGATYVSSMGNENVRLAGHNIGSYETPQFRPMKCPAAIPQKFTCHDFAPAANTQSATNGYTLPSGGGLTAVLQWAEPLGAVTDTFYLYVLDHRTHQVLTESSIPAIQAQTPEQFSSWINLNQGSQKIDLVIARSSGKGLPRLRYVMFNSGPISGAQRLVAQAPDSIGGGQGFGHNVDPLALTVAAAPFDNPTVTEDFSGRGPLTYLFGPSMPAKPATPLPHPQVYAKPDVTGIDGVLTSFFGNQVGPGKFRFYGTSAAAPGAAGVIALLKQLHPAATPLQLRTAVIGTAKAMPLENADSSGRGLINAYQAALQLARH